MGVERVEIVTDGTSAIYGSDAVAGVVNIISPRSIRGVKVEGDVILLLPPSIRPPPAMPELPDVTIYCEALAVRIVGDPLTAATLHTPFVLRTVEPPLSAPVGS